jgi:putative ABC transport system permease protein
MIPWLVVQSVRRAPRRLVLGAIGVAFPVAMLAATLMFVDVAVRAMTPAALRPVQIEMRAVTTSLGVDVHDVTRKLAAVPGVRLVEPFGATDVVVGLPGSQSGITARLFAVDQSYPAHHPWVRVVSGSLARGALLDQSVRASAGFGSAGSITIALPGDAPPLNVKVPVGGTVDLRRANTWFSVPYGEVQGDIVVVPRAVVIDFATFQREVLPVLRSWARKGGLPPFDPGSSELPSASLEAHVSISHTAYPADPGRAAVFSATVRHLLERQATGRIIVADNSAESLTLAQADATNAKILFLLLGLPGVIVAMALGLAAASALSEAHRREDALLRLRGATDGQIARLAGAHAGVAGLVGSALGLLVAVLAVSAVTGRAVWHGVPTARLVGSSLIALAVGALATGVRLLQLRRAGRRSQVAFERRHLERGWAPTWRRARLDLVAIGVGLAILIVNVVAGGLKQTPIEGTALALSFYVLLAPIALWLGITLLVIRGLIAFLGRRARPESSRPLPSWGGASLRWLARRPARTAVALVLGALAVAFGTSVLAFASTYRTAKAADARAAIGSDLRLTPGDPTLALPQLGTLVAAVSPFHLVPARAGSDRKTIMAIDLASYRATATTAPRMLAGVGPEGFAKDPMGVLIDSELANDFSVGPGDAFPLTIFPDDFESRRTITFHVLGVFRSMPPTSPPAEAVTLLTALPRAQLVPPDFYLARVTPGRTPGAVAARLSQGVLANRFAVSTVGDPSQRGLTALNLAGLSRIEFIGAVLIAAVGVAVLGAFLILERRREFAVLRATGADTAQILTPPAIEGTVAVAFSILIGVPVGLGLGVLAVRVLGLFFALPPPVLTLPAGGIGALIVAVAFASAVALGWAIIAVIRVRPAVVLREQ